MPSQTYYSKIYKGTHKSIEIQQLAEIDVGMANEYVT